MIKKFLGNKVNVKKVRTINCGLLIELDSLNNKTEIIKTKGILKGINLWIENDLPQREEEVQEWLDKIVEEKRKRGYETEVEYQKVLVDGKWYEWNGELSFEKVQINSKLSLGRLRKYSI